MPKKRNDGRYELKVRISKPGEPRKYKAVYGTTLREAQARAKALETEVLEMLDHDQNPTTEELIGYWLTMRERVNRPQTVRNYRYAAKHIINRVGGKMARAVTVDMARKTIDNISDLHSPYTAGRARKIASMVWKDAIARSVVLTNPWEAVPVPKHKAADKRFLSEEELKKLSDAELVPQDRALVDILRYTGLRVGEATALQVKDIDLSARAVNVSKTNVDGEIYPTKTKAGERKVPMPNVLTERTDAYIKEYTDGRPDTYLFAINGRPWGKSTIRRHFLSIGKQAFGDDAPADFTPHIFRHTYTHELVANNIPPLTAQVILGHSSYQITLGVYAHFGWHDIDMSDIIRVFDER